jgi:2-iminobutanoate/2-iminopropanoate deaminase
MTRQATPNIDTSIIGPYSNAVNSGELVFLSGQTGIDQQTGQLIPGDITAQTRQSLVNLLTVLKNAGLTEADVQKVNVYLTDMSDFSSMNEEYQQHFSQPYPARTTIGVAALPLGAKIEIEMIAKSR